MLFNRSVIAALSLITIAASAMTPAHAIVGRLGSHSIGAIRRMQQSSLRLSRTHRHSQRTARKNHGTGLRLVSLKHKRKHGKSGKISIHSPSYLWNAPSQPDDDDSFLDEESRAAISQQFRNGNSEAYSPSSLIQSGVFAYCPLHGGVFQRRNSVKNIILHSTETAREADAQRVITSWNNKGLRHAGAQFVVDRDGTIYCTADPQYGTTHVDNRRTRQGVNNDNSIGIEIVRTGSQEYSQAQLASVVCLVRYLQDRFKVTDNHIFGHGQIQPSDRSDPVNFDWQSFKADKQTLTRTPVATKLDE
ncbi:MAG: N-acetylmuramoyl-L-alanine amidase [Candidatus Melainabacteria bacterium]|nr:MAG: N-acetylmuramoyl-L-alanine amidase [Candidatus Melainabacteria bacterium]